MLHLDPQASAFDYKRQLAEQDYVTTSIAAACSLAESTVGLLIENVLP